MEYILHTADEYSSVQSVEHHEGRAACARGFSFTLEGMYVRLALR